MWVLKGDESRLVALLYLKNILADQAQACTPAIGLRSIDNLKDLTHACFFPAWFLPRTVSLVL